MGIHSFSWNDTLCLLASAIWCGLLCWHDVRTRRLPNWMTLGGAVVALAVRVVWGGFPLFLDGLAAAAVAGGLMLLPFLARGAGGGDVKLLFAAGAVVGWSGMLNFLLLTSVAGVAFGIFLMLVGRLDGARMKHGLRSLADWRYDRKAGRSTLPPRDSERVRMPFAVPVAIGLIGVLMIG